MNQFVGANMVSATRQKKCMAEIKRAIPGIMQQCLVEIKQVNMEGEIKKVPSISPTSHYVHGGSIQKSEHGGSIQSQRNQTS
jgi:hypothetical protein